MTGPLAYLDHAATTPMRPEAVEAMQAYLVDRFGNPSGSHRVARQARQGLDEAREVVAACLGARPGEVVFTAGGTEADNLAIEGVHRARAGVAVTAATEHHAVLHPVERLGGRVVGCGPDGAVDIDMLAGALDPSVSVVSVMLANNEVGTVTALDGIAAVVAERAPGAVLHTDAVQAFCWMDVAALAAPAQLVSVSGHKFGGPKGVGVLVVRDGTAIAPLLLGGGQERDRRSGTQNVAGVVALARAMELVVAERAAVVARVRALRDRLADGLAALVPGLVETVPRHRKVAGSCHVCIEGVESEALLFLLDRAGVCASAASACASGATDPSHVLAAMGVPRATALGALRLSLGPTSTDADVDRALDVIPAAVARLRR